MKLFIIVFLVCLAMVTSEDAKKKWKEINQKEKKIIVKEEENFKVGDIVKNEIGEILEIVPYREYREWNFKKKYWSEYYFENERINIYYCKNKRGTWYSTENIKNVTKATKIEEFIFKNGGKENE